MKFRGYRFGIAMEGHSKLGYITEKIVNAFLGGTVPIYSGTEDVFAIFNAKAFIFYNASKGKSADMSALHRIAYLEKHPNAYRAMLKEPILKDGEETLRKYFSLSDDVGGGELRRKIQTLIEANPREKSLPNK